MTKIKGSEQLAKINQKVIEDGQNLPSVKLKDGSTVQTGTVATMLHNIQLYNAGERGSVEDELILAIPTLLKVGIFDLFSVDEWIAGDNSGRSFVGVQTKKYLDKIVNTL
ncbi:hypothetical protein GCM10027155_19120 [Acinetobacter apis]|uniref:DUF7709 domain-containing protein n=1 Tax=Acinetobacter apis TaxID=1229165 RepID=A0A217EIM5_9GAMM|nr:hypothetical protein [Acinetobacter apis]SNQ30267.1 hypothetical protein SAMN05444584_2256 [Acinetobacter apis]